MKKSTKFNLTEVTMKPKLISSSWKRQEVCGPRLALWSSVAVPLPPQDVALPSVWPAAGFQVAGWRKEGGQRPAQHSPRKIPGTGRRTLPLVSAARLWVMPQLGQEGWPVRALPLPLYTRMQAPGVLEAGEGVPGGQFLPQMPSAQCLLLSSFNFLFYVLRSPGH